MARAKAPEPSSESVQVSSNTDNHNPEDTNSSSPGFWSATGVAVLTILTGLIAGFLVFKSWEGIASDLGAFSTTAAIAGAHTFALSLLGLTLLWAVILAVVFAAIGFFANVFTT
ncbi:MAG TPA: hypothetical protein VM347_18405 [Nonomuraea sp.]|nr:hypothetical protein [Nonomuraea sp.]